MAKKVTDWTKLIAFFECFENKPGLLCKYLVENQALSPEFVKKVLGEKWTKFPDFKSVSQLEDYLSEIPAAKKPSDAVAKANAKLDKLIRDERYEDAAVLRDWMEKKRIPRI